ncbi:XRE family transcriptional regulator [Carnimonas bestiolae]|uniref:XRE family transcriptional regulator n=1 Tax=Carnimonas bestiolae TaxID=3402172 RepID=UPI003EDB8509
MFSGNIEPTVHIKPELKVSATPLIIEPMVREDRQKWRDEFASRLRAALNRKEISEHGSGVYLKRLTGVSDKAASKWLNGESIPSDAKIASIARELGVTIEWLRYGRGTSSAKIENELTLRKMELVEQASEPITPDEVLLPMFREVEFAAGEGCTQVIENHGAEMKFSLARLSRAGVNPEDAACATVHGKSMEPTIIDGSPIAIDKGCTSVIDGKIYALDHGGMLRVKRLYKLPLNRVRIVSDNSEEYPEESCTMGHADSPRIIGRVFWWEVFD